MKSLASILTVLAALPLSAYPPKGMFELYERNRAEGRANYTTEDFILLSYSLTLDSETAAAEERLMLPLVKQLISALKNVLPSTGRKPAEDLAYAYLAVLSGLAEGKPPTASASAVEEYQRVQSASGVARSPLMLQTIDYSQFQLRGRYRRTPALGTYFVAMRYAGTVLFPVLESQSTNITTADADQLTASALVLSRLLARKDLASTYCKLSRWADVLAGLPEDLTTRDLADVSASLAVPEARRRLLTVARANHRQPEILAAPVDVTRLEPGITAADALTGWRLLPSRYTPDSSALQQVVFNRVGKYKGTGQPHSAGVINGQIVRAFPQARDVIASLGSREGAAELDKTDERNFENYEPAAAKARALLATSKDFAAVQLRMVHNRLPSSENADPAQRLQAELAFWTWIRYNNFLYSKQSYTAVAKSISLSGDREKAWIEPSAKLYLDLALQLERLKPLFPGGKFASTAAIFRQCAAIAKAEIAGKTRDPKQAAFLNHLDEAMKEFSPKGDHPIVIDVHTEPNSGLVLEEALAYPRVVTKKLEGTEAIGVRFHHVEFKHKLSNRLTDEQWAEILERESQK